MRDNEVQNVKAAPILLVLSFIEYLVAIYIRVYIDMFYTAMDYNDEIK